jgi:pyruvate dehydrogenase (quinone)
MHERPGAIHLLNGLYDAKLDHQPVVAIVGQTAFAGVGGSAQQETNLRALLQDVASSYLEVVSKPEQLSHVVDRAFRAALATARWRPSSFRTTSRWNRP